jgi:pyruvate dehydrogenase E2 component (dihydrolipoamide acetyltransferase)
MQIKTPDLGVDKAELIELLIKVGDSVAAGQSVAVAESSKASVEIPSPVAGTVTAVLVSVGQMIQEHVPLFEVADEQSSQAASAPKPDQPSTSPVESTSTAPTSDTQPSPQPQATTQTSSQTLTVPDLGVDQAEVSEVLVKVGDTLTIGQSVAVVESSKASVEIPTTLAGMVSAVLIKPQQIVKQGDVVLTLQAESSSQPSTPTPVPVVDNSVKAVDNVSPPVDKSTPTALSLAPPTIQPSSDAIYAGPAVRKLARELGVDLAQVQGSAHHQRIIKEDVYAHVKQRLQQPVVVQSSAPAPVTQSLPPLPDMSKWGALHSEQLSRIQQAAVTHLSLNTYIPQVTQFDQADITELEALRNQLKDGYKKQGVSLTILAFIAKAVAHLLLQEQRFNSHLADDGKSLIIRDEVHLGIAVATEDGLIVPVLRRPEQKGIRQIAEELQMLGQKARDKKLSPADLAGASFTISSLGNLGGTGFTPLVSWPQVAILGISPAAMQPMWDGSAFVPRLMLPLSLSYDHRVINGADAARFARRLAELLADLRQVLL